MAIKIQTEKVTLINKIGPQRKILGFSLLGYSEVPPEYRDKRPCCYDNSNVCDSRGTIAKVLGSDYSDWHLQKGEVYSEESFQQMLTVLHECGARLKAINQERQELAKAWRGEETFII